MNINLDLKHYFKAILLETSEDKNEVPSIYAKWVNWNGPDTSPNDTPNHLKIVPPKSKAPSPATLAVVVKRSILLMLSPRPRPIHKWKLRALSTAGMLVFTPLSV